jgi:hypothetical protein
MKKYIYFISMIFIFVSCKITPKMKLDDSDTFYKMYGGALDEKAYAIEEDTDGGFLIAGSINVLQQDPLTGSDIEKETAYLIKTDKFGNLRWKKTYKGQAARALAKDPTGGWYVGVDSTNKVGNLNYTNFSLLKIDNEGNEQSVRLFGQSPRFEQIKSVFINTEKNRIYIVGDHRPSILSANILMYIVVADLQGNILNTKEYGSVDPTANVPLPGPNDVGNVLIDVNTSNKDLIFCGTTLKQGNNRLDIRVAPFNGDLIIPTGDYAYGTEGEERGEQIINTRDRNAVLIGTTNGLGNGGRDMYAIKINITREFGTGKWLAVTKDWEKTFGGGGDDDGKSICQTSDGGYLLLGSVATTTDLQDIYLVKLDGLGGLVWEKQFGGSRNDYGRIVKEASNGDILILGTITFENNSMITLIRTSKDGELVK